MEYLVLYFVYLIISAIRVDVMLSIRIKAIKDDFGLYTILPSYSSMVFNPMQWHMWTYNQYSKRCNK